MAFVFRPEDFGWPVPQQTPWFDWTFSHIVGAREALDYLKRILPELFPGFPREDPELGQAVNLWLTHHALERGTVPPAFLMEVAPAIRRYMEAREAVRRAEEAREAERPGARPLEQTYETTREELSDAYQGLLERLAEIPTQHVPKKHFHRKLERWSEYLRTLAEAALYGTEETGRMALDPLGRAAQLALQTAITSQPTLPTFPGYRRKVYWYEPPSRAERLRHPAATLPRAVRHEAYVSAPPEDYFERISRLRAEAARRLAAQRLGAGGLGGVLLGLTSGIEAARHTLARQARALYAPQADVLNQRYQALLANALRQIAQAEYLGRRALQTAGLAYQAR